MLLCHGSSGRKCSRGVGTQVRLGAERARKRNLKTAAVVGVTCCSAGLPLMDDQHFDVVILDECSQMVEPLSLLPLARAGCRWGLHAIVWLGNPARVARVLLLVHSKAHLFISPTNKHCTKCCRFAILSGDPQQLPPLIANPAHTLQQGAHGMSRPLFMRLASMGHTVHLLRRQYRWSTFAPPYFLWTVIIHSEACFLVALW
jgi:hypothetical protein